MDVSYFYRGATNIKMNYFFKSWHAEENNFNQIALTFDDGPNPNSLQILEILKKHSSESYFFLHRASRR